VEDNVVTALTVTFKSQMQVPCPKRLGANGLVFVETVVDAFSSTRQHLTRQHLATLSPYTVQHVSLLTFLTFALRCM
jgi:hypothetical protein